MSDRKVVRMDGYRGNLYTVAEGSRGFILLSVTSEGCTEQMVSIKNLSSVEVMALIGSMEKVKHQTLNMHKSTTEDIGG